MRAYCAPAVALLLLLCTLLAWVGAGQTAQLSCDTQQELIANLEFVRTVCGQAHENFAEDDPHNPLPLTCTHPTCARVVRRVAGDCSEILRQGWFTTWSNKLAALVNQSSRVPQPPNVYPIGLATPTMFKCDGMLTDGDGQNGLDWKKQTVVDAGPGKVAQVTVQTLGLGSGDSLQIFDGRDCDPGPLRLRLARLLGNVLPSQPTYTASGRFMCVQLLTDKHGLGSGFTMTVGCVCTDSPTWMDTAGRPCDHFARNATSSAFDACEGSAATVPAQGPTQTGLVLPAEQACPRACEACGVDPCSAWPCQHGGECLQPEPRQCQTAGQFAILSTDVTAACCNGAGEDCVRGTPRTCYADCARILVPMHDICSKGILQTPGYETTKQTMDAAVAKCAAGHDYALLAAPTCSCVSGWTGAHCEMEDAQCASVSCGGHGSCRAGACECTAGWSGPTCQVQVAHPSNSYVITGAHNAKLNGVYTKTVHICQGMPVWQKGGNSGYVLYTDDGEYWEVSTTTSHATSCDWDSSTLYNSNCGDRPDSCEAGEWQEHGSTNPAVRAVFTEGSSDCAMAPDCGHGMCIGATVTTAGTCSSTGGASYAYCASTDTHYCCGTCTGSRTCPENTDLLDCACESDSQVADHRCICDYGFSGSQCDHDPCAGADCGVGGSCVRNDNAGLGHTCVSNAYVITGTHDAKLNGTYTKTDRICSGMPVWQKGGSDGYVLYRAHENSHIQWHVSNSDHATSCSGDTAHLFSDTCSDAPDSCNAEKWHEHNSANPVVRVVPTWGTGGCAAAPSCGHGVCIAQGASHSCGCAYGFSGSQCDHDPCAGADCGVGSSCVRNADGLGHTCVSNAYVITGTHDAKLNGTYTKTDRICSGMPVWQKGGSDGYVLYNAPYDDTSSWFVSTSDYATSCSSDTGRLYLEDADGAPNSGCGKWKEHDSTNPAVRVVPTWGTGGCAAAPSCGHGVCIAQGASHSCGCAYGFSGSQCDHDPCAGADCGVGSSCVRNADGLGHTCVSNAYVIIGTHDAKLNGTYTKTNHICNGMPVWQKGGSDGYVLYRPQGYSHWNIGTSDHVKACYYDDDLLYPGSYSSCNGAPDNCNTGDWEEHGSANPVVRVVPTWGTGGCAAIDCGHGVCIAQGASHSCACAYGFSGSQCEYDPCAGVSCGPHSSCVRNAGGLGHTCYHDAYVITGTTEFYYSTTEYNVQLNGTYTKTHYTCNGQPVWQKGGSDGYVLYNAPYDDTSSWFVSTSDHATSCSSDTNRLYLADGADGAPNSGCGKWHEHGSTNPAVRVMPKPEPEPEPEPKPEPQPEPEPEPALPLGPEPPTPCPAGAVYNARQVAMVSACCPVHGAACPPTTCDLECKDSAVAFYRDCNNAILAQSSNDQQQLNNFRALCEAH
jgi:hypothetical protein